MYLRPVQPARKRNGNEMVRLPEATATSVDWRNKGAVTPVKDKGECGGSWAFATTGSIEGAYAIVSGSLVALSEQQLLDCTNGWPWGNQGCSGGTMDTSFRYIITNGGLASESHYPYTGQDGECEKSNAARHDVSIKGFNDVTPYNDTALAAAVAKGPVAVAVDADQTNFQFYKSGIYSGPCGTALDSGVLVVGYTPDHWIVKNSWGTSWGEQGYIMMSRSVGGRLGLCGILMLPSYPVV